MKEISVISLRALTQAALANAESLLQEANSLLSSEHFARAYFLAVASIEETGKAAIAFNASGRNLAEPLVARAVRNKLLDHKAKIISAFAPSLRLTAKENLSEALEASMKLMGDLRRGREPSMYTEILADGSIQMPSAIVRPVAAKDVVRLAMHCLLRAKDFVASNEPANTSAANDFFFAQSSSKIQEIMGHEQFSGFYLDRIKGGESDLEEALHAFVTRTSA